MRSAIVILMIPVLIVGLAAWGYITSRRTSGEVTRRIEELSAYVQSGQWDDARREARALTDTWRKTQKIWGLVMDHHEIDALDTSIVRMVRLIHLEEKADALAEAAVAYRMAKHIPEREVPGIGNVF